MMYSCAVKADAVCHMLIAITQQLNCTGSSSEVYFERVLVVPLDPQLGGYCQCLGNQSFSEHVASTFIVRAAMMSVGQ